MKDEYKAFVGGNVLYIKHFKLIFSHISAIHPQKHPFYASEIFYFLREKGIEVGQFYARTETQTILESLKCTKQSFLHEFSVLFLNFLILFEI